MGMQHEAMIIGKQLFDDVKPTKASPTATVGDIPSYLCHILSRSTNDAVSSKLNMQTSTDSNTMVCLQRHF